MIARHHVLCPGCQAKIVLRLSVGFEERQPFFFPCRRCGAITRGALIVDSPPNVRLVLEEGSITGDFNTPDQSITINPDFPAVTDAGEMWDVGGSPFMLLHSILGDDLEQYQQRLRQFREPVALDWPKLRRVTRWYLDDDWPRMFGGLQEILPGEKLNPDDSIQRHHHVHRLYDVIFASLQILPYYPSMKKEWNDYWDPARPNRDALVRYAKIAAASPRLRTLQSDLFDRMARYIDLRGAVLPGFAVDMIRERGRVGHPELRLCRDDFPELRDLYISTFETCHHVLRFVVGVSNARLRGNHDDFGPGTRRERPRHLDDFDGLRNADKPKWLSEFPFWQESWEYLLNRPLRNAIGHQSVRHNLRNGLLEHDDDEPVKYVDFVAATYRLVYPMLACANVMKIIRIWSAAEDRAKPA